MRNHAFLLMISWTTNNNIIQSRTIPEYHGQQKQANILMCNKITLKRITKLSVPLNNQEKKSILIQKSKK